jgi:hypothetical protein
MNKSELVAIREYLPGDRNFILATWLRGAYYGQDYFRQIPKDTFMAQYHAFVEKILASPSVKIRVACLKDDPEVILGYSVLGSESQVLNWVFVKSAWRAIGIGKSLIPPQVQSVSHITKVGQSILAKHPDVVFNPFKVL